MKTKIILMIIGFLITSSSFADNFKMKEEACIDDIPFNTAEIAKHYMNLGNDSVNFTAMPTEAYIDDIPFDTRLIAYRCLNKRSQPASAAVLRYLIITRR